MKKNLFVTLIGLMFAISAIAQEQPRRNQMSPDEAARKQTLILKERLGLSADQEKKIYEINLRFANENVAKREAVKQERKLMVNKMREKDSIIQTVLTPEQKKFYLVYKEIKRGDMKKDVGRNKNGKDRLERAPIRSQMAK